ncbi:MAG: hypothetical protein Q4F30_09755 [Akkermansia sp.]|nr:hypothetical protein [Akkermansia sp.]
MKTYMYLPLGALALASCLAQPAVQPVNRPAATQSAQVDVAGLGKRIWANECAGSVQGLVSWNAGEAFPSLGIGHFIWYPAGVQERFDESFPKFVAYARRSGVQVPAMFDGPAPWADKAAFLADKSGRAGQMRQWLAQHVELQTRFIMARSRAAAATMARMSSNPQAVAAHYNALAATTQGMYCLVDYVNFKGEGVKATERYNNQGWGLLQVLEEMKGNPQGRAATAEFSRAAAAVLTRRVNNAPADRGERRWLPGWLNRCATYR